MSLRVMIVLIASTRALYSYFIGPIACEAEAHAGCIVLGGSQHAARLGSELDEGSFGERREGEAL